MYKFFTFLSFSLLAVTSGCNPDGIFYDFMSFESYDAGEVHEPRQVDLPELPVTGEDAPVLRFMALGCAGAGNEGQRIVARNMNRAAGLQETDFVLYLGDNFYGRGVDSVHDEQWQTKFEKVYDGAQLQIPFYAVLGNHDHFRNPMAQVRYSERSDRWKMPARYYRFERQLADGTRIDFFGLDTQALLAGDPPQLEWLEQELAGSRAGWKIVFGHHPLYSGTIKYKKHNAGQMRRLLEPVLKEGNVDLYISAHAHNLELTEPISGIRYAVSGGGSRPRDIYWEPRSVFALADLGFMLFQVYPGFIQVDIYGRDGEIVFRGLAGDRSEEAGPRDSGPPAAPVPAGATA